MAELTPEENAALSHWAHVGAPGTTPADGWVPTRLEDFARPASGDWPFEFDDAQTRTVIAGHRAMEMEDKWHVIALPNEDPAQVTVEFVRSWTGFPVVRIDLELTERGSRVARATWETDPERLKTPTEEFARSEFVSVVRDVLRLPNAPTTAGSVRVVIEPGDITRITADAVVNAANSTLLGGGGVDGAIHRAGGPAILEACRALRATTLPEGLPAGSAVATIAGELPARWVIHTIGPVWSSKQDRSEVLASCYRESLRVADDLGAAVVTFPAISAGAYGWPIDDAARIAVQTVRSTATSVREVIFVLRGEVAIAAFEKALGS